MKISELIKELEKLDPNLEVITTINKDGDRLSIECVDVGYFDEGKFTSIYSSTNEIKTNAVDLVWSPL